MPASFDTARAGVDGDPSLLIQPRHLAHLMFFIPLQQGFQGLNRTQPPSHKGKSSWPIVYVSKCLGRNYPYSCFSPGYNGANREVVRLHRDAHLASMSVTSDDRIGMGKGIGCS